jgi:glycosyltransferase 2 family protein
MESPPRAAPARRRLRAGLVFLLLVIALFLLVPRIAGERHALELLRDASPWLLAVAVLAEAVSLVLYSALFRRLLVLLRHTLSLGTALRINLAGLTAAHLFSAGGVGGAALTYRILRKRGLSHATVLIAVIFQNAFAYGVLFALFAVALVGLLLGGDEGSFAVLFAAAIIMLVVAGAAYGFWLLSHPTALRRAVRRALAALSRISRRAAVPPAQLEEWIDGVVEGWRLLRNHGHGHLRSLAVAAGYWTFDILCLVLVLLAFHQHVQLWSVIVAYAVANAAGTFSPTPGGLGAVEGLLIAFLTGMGLDPAAAVAVTLVYRLINFWLPMPAGAVCYLTLR